jgi:hypothetical protein
MRVCASRQRDNVVTVEISNELVFGKVLDNVDGVQRREVILVAG